MDRFLDEQENPSQHRDRSSSPNIHSLIAGDHKRQHHNRTPPSCAPSAEDIHHSFQPQVIVEHLPQKTLEITLAPPELQGSSSSVLSSVNMEELSSGTVPNFGLTPPSTGFKAVRNQTEEHGKNVLSNFERQSHGTLVKISSREPSSPDDIVGNAATAYGEASNRTVCTLNNNNNNNSSKSNNNNNNNNRNNVSEMNHHQNASLKNYEVALASVSTNASTGNRGSLPSDGILTSTATANSAM